MQRSREQSIVSAPQSDSESSEVRVPVPPAATPGKLVYMLEDDGV